MGKKKDKNNKKKDNVKRKDEDRPGRKDLLERIETLQAENEALRARLERIAEIAEAPAAADSYGIEAAAAPIDGQAT